MSTKIIIFLLFVLFVVIVIYYIYNLDWKLSETCPS